jgi:hypothetical protein
MNLASNQSEEQLDFGILDKQNVIQSKRNKGNWT